MPITESDLHRSFYCEARNRPKGGSYYTTLAKCCACRAFPCVKINKQTYTELLASDLIEVAGARLKPRRTKMYLFVYEDGAICSAYDGFDPNNPSGEHLRNVKEVLCVSKVLVPQLKLVPKPKEQTPAAKTTTKQSAKKKAA